MRPSVRVRPRLRQAPKFSLRISQHDLCDLDLCYWGFRQKRKIIPTIWDHFGVRPSIRVRPRLRQTPKFSLQILQHDLCDLDLCKWRFRQKRKILPTIWDHFGVRPSVRVRPRLRQAPKFSLRISQHDLCDLDLSYWVFRQKRKIIPTIWDQFGVRLSVRVRPRLRQAPKFALRISQHVLCDLDLCKWGFRQKRKIIPKILDHFCVRLSVRVRPRLRQAPKFALRISQHDLCDLDLCYWVFKQKRKIIPTIWDHFGVRPSVRVRPRLRQAPKFALRISQHDLCDLDLCYWVFRQKRKIIPTIWDHFFYLLLWAQAFVTFLVE